jgi:hypothetical protein
MLWAMTDHAGFITSSDAGRHWTLTGNGLPLISSENLAVHPLNSNLMFTGVHAAEALGGQGLYRSLDGGQTWTRQDAGLEANAEIRDVVMDPVNPAIAYCCDHLSGVYATTDSGDTWFSVNEGLDHRTMNILALNSDGSVLYAGVEGAGVYRLGTPQVTGVKQYQNSTHRSFHLYSNYPNPFNMETTIRYDILKQKQVRVDIVNIQGRIVKTLINEKQTAGSYQLSWHGKDHINNEVGSGVYFCWMICDDQTMMQKMLILK